MSAMLQLIIACALLIITHFLLSHPFRRMLTLRMGEGAFLGLYSLIAIICFAWIVVAWLAVPAGPPAYIPGPRLWAVASFLMWCATVLLVGAFRRNPALPSANAMATASTKPLGVLAITRHPMMWSFAIWALVHMLLWPTPENHVLTTAILILALGGAFAQDMKKARLMGATWRSWMGRTAFIPFWGQISGRIGWSAAWPGWPVIVTASLLWLGITWLHVPLGARIAAGVWYWL